MIEINNTVLLQIFQRGNEQNLALQNGQADRPLCSSDVVRSTSNRSAIKKRSVYSV